MLPAKLAIFQDTREHKGKKEHILSVFRKYGIKVIPHGLYVGDWSLVLEHYVIVDTKTLGLQEVYSNLVQDHERFRNECIKASEVGIRLIVLVEEKGIVTLDDVPNWVNPRSIIYQKQRDNGKATAKAAPISSERLYNIMRTMSELYGVEWAFTTHERCADTILQLLGVQLF